MADGDVVYKCAIKGVFRKNGTSPLVGDVVDFEITHDGDREGNITKIHERTSELTRPRVANIEQAVFVAAAKAPIPNPDMLDKFLIMAAKHGIEAVIAINKAELGEALELERLAALYRGIGYSVMIVSAATGLGLEGLRHAMGGKLSVMAGASGVGKSSLVNALVPGADMRTGQLSERIGRGKHTTRHAELFAISPGGFVVDTPGFSNLEELDVEAGELASCFREFGQYLGECRFRNCLHLDEPDCAIKAAVGAGISPERYERYKNILISKT